jgi:hypothetical protein
VGSAIQLSASRQGRLYNDSRRKAKLYSAEPQSSQAGASAAGVHSRDLLRVKRCANGARRLSANQAVAARSNNGADRRARGQGVAIEGFGHSLAWRFGVGDSPDVLAFDTGSKRLYVSAESGVVTVAAEHGKRLVKLGQAFLASNAHTVAVDSATHLVYFPLESGSGGRPELRIMAPKAAS